MFERLFRACFTQEDPADTNSPSVPRSTGGSLRRMDTIDMPVIVEPLKDEWLLLAQAPEDLGVVNYEGKIVKGRVAKVLDGETVQVVILNDQKLESHRFRLSGIDAPEQEDDAIVSKTKLEEKLAEDSNLVMVNFIKDDKYGRRVGSLSTRSGVNINDWMVTKGYASASGKKKPFEVVKQAIEDVVKQVFEPRVEARAEPKPEEEEKKE